jgi:integrase
VQITSTLIRVKGEACSASGPRAGRGSAPCRRQSAPWRCSDGDLCPGLARPAAVPDVLGGFRDPSNVRRVLREARGEEALAWITSHTFRKTAATILYEAALSARLVADQLGHSRPSMTQDVYMGRRAVDSQAALALDAALRNALPDGQFRGKTVANEEGQQP